MGAREKLNSAYIGMAAFSAGVLGIVTKSITVSAVTFAVLTGALLHDGSIRPKKRR